MKIWFSCVCFLSVVFQALKSVVLYVILSPYDNEQSDLVHRISKDKKLEEIPKYKCDNPENIESIRLICLMRRGYKFHIFICRDLLKQFTTMELMRWTSLVDDYGKELRDGSPDSPATDVFSYSEEGEKRWKDLKNRVVEHVSWHLLLLFHWQPHLPLWATVFEPVFGYCVWYLDIVCGCVCVVNADTEFHSSCHWYGITFGWKSDFICHACVFIFLKKSHAF